MSSFKFLSLSKDSRTVIDAASAASVFEYGAGLIFFFSHIDALNSVS
jgi:hypothetical protein